MWELQHKPSHFRARFSTYATWNVQWVNSDQNCTQNKRSLLEIAFPANIGFGYEMWSYFFCI